MTVRSSALDVASVGLIVRAGYGRGNSREQHRDRRGTGSADGQGDTTLAVSRSRSTALDPLGDLLADRRRPLRTRARDRVRDPGGLRRNLVHELQPDPAGARERRDPRVADDDVLRRAVLHAAAARRYARNVERTA